MSRCEVMGRSQSLGDGMFLPTPRAARQRQVERTEFVTNHEPHPQKNRVPPHFLVTHQTTFTAHLGTSHGAGSLPYFSAVSSLLESCPSDRRSKQRTAVIHLLQPCQQMRQLAVA